MNELDINCYFRDRFGRLCVLASAGGAIPNFLNREEAFNINAEINKQVYNTLSTFNISRNPILNSILASQYPNIDNDTISDVNETYNFTDRYNLKLAQLPKHINLEKPNNNNDFHDFYQNFDDLAKRGLYVYDKLNINYPDSDEFILVSYPIYDRNNLTQKKLYKNQAINFEKSPSIKKSIITKRNDKFYKSNFRILNLINTIDSQ